MASTQLTSAALKSHGSIHREDKQEATEGGWILQKRSAWMLQQWQFYQSWVKFHTTTRTQNAAEGFCRWATSSYFAADWPRVWLNTVAGVANSHGAVICLQCRPLGKT